MNKNKIAIITMANNDYLPFTKNCIKSLEKIGLKDLIRVYCVDADCYENISKEHPHTQLIKHNLSGDLDKLQRFPKGPAKLIKLEKTESTFKDLVFLKFIALSDALKKYGLSRPDLRVKSPNNKASLCNANSTNSFGSIIAFVCLIMPVSCVHAKVSTHL